MHVPIEFRNMCRNMGPHLDEFVGSLDDLVQVALSGVDRHDLDIIRSFLDEILNMQINDEQLIELWWSMPVTMVFSKGPDIAAFLKRMREMLDQAPYGCPLSGTSQ